MNIPIELFSLFIGTSIALAIFGFLRNPQIPAMLVFGGIFILSIVVSTDNIIMGTSVSDSVITQELVSNTTNYHYNVESQQTSLQTGNYAGASFARAESAVMAGGSILIGEKIQCVDVLMQRVGSPPSGIIMNIALFSTTSENIIQTFGTQTVSSISTTPTFYTYCLTEGSEVEIVNGGKIGVIWKESLANSTNHIRLFRDDTNPFDGTNTVVANIPFGSAGWSATTGSDLSMRLYDFELEYQTIQNFDNTQTLYEFTELPKTLFALLAVIFMLTGGLMVFTRER